MCGCHYTLKAGLKVTMRILVLAMDTGFDLLEPFILKDTFNGDTGFRIWIKDPLHQLSRSSGQPLNGLVVVSTAHVQVVLVVEVLGCCGTERNALVDHAVIDNTAGPDIDAPCVILLVLERFRGNVRF